MIKETFEWVRSWLDYADRTDLPRVLLIGDSITEGYQGKVRDNLRGKAYVDYMATSTTYNSELFHSLVKNLVDCYGPYDVIHFNQGLHGKWMDAEEYTEGLKRIIPSLKAKKVILVTSTDVYADNLNKIDETWAPILKDRNDAVKKMCVENGFACDDLSEVARKIPLEERSGDGFHFKDEGYRILAAAVANIISENM